MKRDGIDIPAGTMIMVNNGAANRDPHQVRIQDRMGRCPDHGTAARLESTGMTSWRTRGLSLIWMIGCLSLAASNVSAASPTEAIGAAADLFPLD